MSDTPIFDEVCAALLFTPDPPLPPAPPPAPRARPARRVAQTGEWFRAPADVQATQMLPAVVPAVATAGEQ